MVDAHGKNKLKKTVMNKMYLDQLQHYLENTPKEVLEKEYKEWAYLNDIGPNVTDLLKHSRQ